MFKLPVVLQFRLVFYWELFTHLKDKKIKKKVFREVPSRSDIKKFSVSSVKKNRKIKSIDTFSLVYREYSKGLQNTVTNL
jgi:hypothetical protein